MSGHKKGHIIMVGPHLDVKGGVSSSARYCLESELSKKHKIFYHPTTIDGAKILKSLYFIKSFTVFLIRLVSDRDIQIVHILSASGGSFYRKAAILFLAKLFKKKTIYHIEGACFDLFYEVSPGFRRFLIRKTLDITDTVAVLSKSWLLKVSKMTNNKNITIIPNSVDTNLFKSIVGKRSYSKLNILTLGRLEHRKGTYDTLDIIPGILREMPDVKFYFAGDGDIEEVIRLSKDKMIDSNVTVLGWLDRKAKIEALGNASIFLLPSYNEGVPVAIIEAMAAGLPIVSTKVGGIPEVVEEETNGFLVNPGDKENLARRIIGLLKDEGLRERIGKRNIDKIDSTCKVDSIAERISAEYSSLLKEV